MSSDCHPVRPLRQSHVTALGMTKLRPRHSPRIDEAQTTSQPFGVTKLSDADGLRHQVSVPDRNRALRCLEAAALPRTEERRGERASLLEAAVADAFTRLLQPAMVREP